MVLSCLDGVRFAMRFQTMFEGKEIWMEKFVN